MSMLFINQKDIEDLKEQIEEEFGLKPPKKDKKETVEDRIIKRCESVQKDCSLLLDQIPRYGSIKNAIECATGKDFITGEEFGPKERIKCAIGAVAGIEDFVPSNMEIGGMTKVGLDILNMVDQINSTKEVLEREKERDEELNRNRKRNRNRSRSRDKSNSKKEGRRKAQKKKK